MAEKNRLWEVLSPPDQSNWRGHCVKRHERLANLICLRNSKVVACVHHKFGQRDSRDFALARLIGMSTNYTIGRVHT